MEPPLDQNVTEPPDATQTPPAPPQRRCLPHGCMPWGFAAFVAFVLVGLLIPITSSCGRIGPQTRSLAQAKQVGLALKLFAGDHEGRYPGQGIPTEMKEVPQNANEAFACLFPTYTSSETIFGNRLSAYQVGLGPDNVIDNPYTGHPVQTLRPGENVYGYMMGFTEEANPSSPLVIDGSDGSGHYNKAPGVRGGTWSKGRAIVIHLDNSGGIETLKGPDNTLYIPRPGEHLKNALNPDYLGKDVRYLDPAVAGP